MKSKKYKQLIIDGDIESLSPFEFTDIQYAFKKAVECRKNCKAPIYVFEGVYLTVTIRVTNRGVYHANW